MRIRIISIILMGTFSYIGVIRADQYHYSNILVGDRGMGMGGAFCAVADDASGVVYNPAGIAYALSNDISGSANAFYGHKITYKSTLGSANFVEESSGSMAPFFGGLQKVDNIFPGLVVAFGISNLDSNLKDQDDLIENQAFKIKNRDSDGNFVHSDSYVNRLHRAVTQRASTQSFGIAVAKRFRSNLSLGIALNFIKIEELTQEYQDNQISTSAADLQKTQIVQNIRQLLSASALEPSIGVQWAFASEWSFGIVFKAPLSLTQSFTRALEVYNYKYEDPTASDPDSLQETSINMEQYKSKAGTQKALSHPYRTQTDEKFKNPIGTFPIEIRTGLAWFASPRLLMTMDIIHKGESTDGETIVAGAAKDPDSGNPNLYYREAVNNIAFGTEYYLTPTLPLRFGLFTNKDARPKIDANKKNQFDNIDYIGSSLFLGWVQPNSQIALGGILQNGTGKAQKAGGYMVQEVSAMSWAVGFAATHSF